MDMGGMESSDTDRIIFSKTHLNQRPAHTFNV